MQQKTALVLGGGGARGAYEIGVWQALRELGLRLSLVVGASVGAINAALVAQDSYDTASRMWGELETDMVFDVNPLKRDDLPLRGLLERHIDEAAVRASEVEYGLVTAELPSLTPHYLYIRDIPQGRLIDFILASASIFPAILPQEIDNSKYVDGGYTDAIPVKMALDRKMARIFAVDLGSGITGRQRLRQAEGVTYISSAWELGNIIIFDGDNARRNMRLGYLDTLKQFGFYEGNRYTFMLRSFAKKDLENAEAAGRMFDLPSGLLYTRRPFEERLRDRTETYHEDLLQDLDVLQNAVKTKNRLSQTALASLFSKVNEKTLTLWLLDRLRNGASGREPWLSLLGDPWKAARFLRSLD